VFHEGSFTLGTSMNYSLRCF